jgi:hypothetical protein
VAVLVHAAVYATARDSRRGSSTGLFDEISVVSKVFLAKLAKEDARLAKKNNQSSCSSLARLAFLAREINPLNVLTLACTGTFSAEVSGFEEFSRQVRQARKGRIERFVQGDPPLSFLGALGAPLRLGEKNKSPRTRPP